MTFNTVYPTLNCPFCKEAITSGVGFAVGRVNRDVYKIGDELRWDTLSGRSSRPVQKPELGNIDTIGYFNCDNVSCSSWSDCFPEVQRALIKIRANKIEEVELYNQDGELAEFAILWKE